MLKSLSSLIMNSPSMYLQSSRVFDIILHFLKYFRFLSFLFGVSAKLGEKHEKKRLIARTMISRAQAQLVQSDSS